MAWCSQDSNQHLKDLIKLLWTHLKPEIVLREDGTTEQKIKLIAVDHEGCSSSFFMHGFSVDIVWDLAGAVEQEVRSLHRACGLGSSIENRAAFTKDLMRLFILNRTDVIVVEDDNVLQGPQSCPDRFGQRKLTSMVLAGSLCIRSTNLKKPLYQLHSFGPMPEVT